MAVGSGGGGTFVSVPYIPDVVLTGTTDEKLEAIAATIKLMLEGYGRNRIMAPDPDPDTFSGASPANEATDVLITDNLAWDAQDNADYYNVYFDTTSPPVFVEQIAAGASPSYALATLDPGTTYYWRIGMVNDGIETLGAVQQFTTQAIPSQITSPVPADEAVDITITDNLAWTAGAGADTFDVYFGEVEADVLAATTSDPEFQGNQAGTTFALATLDPDTTYYWRIDSINEAGTRTGDVLEFTTLPLPAQVSGVLPVTPSVDQRLDTTLAWDAADDAAEYKVYFGVDSTPDATELVSTQAGLTYDPGALDPDTTYYFRIDSVNSSGETTGVVHEFTTAEVAIAFVTATGTNEVAWEFSDTVAALNAETGAVLELEKDSVWYAPTGIVLQAGSIMATYAETFSGGENYRVLNPLPLATFTGGGTLAAPQTGTTGT